MFQSFYDMSANDADKDDAQFTCILDTTGDLIITIDDDDGQHILTLKREDAKKLARIINSFEV